MKTEKAIQVLRDYNLWRRGNEEMEQPDPREIGEAIDSVLVVIQKAEAELDEARADLGHLKEQLDYTRKQRDKMVDDLDQLVLTVSDIRDARGMV
jgi:seryl-tRNA synthetase